MKAFLLTIMSLPNVNMRSVVKSVESTYICEKSEPMALLETVIFQVVHLTTLRTKAQFFTGVLAAASALHGGRLMADINLLLSSIDKLTPLPSDLSEGIAGAPEPPIPTNQAGEYWRDFELFSSRAHGMGPQARAEFAKVQAGELYADKASSLWGAYKSARGTPFWVQCRKIFALIIVGCITSEDLVKSHPRLYKRVVDGTGAVGMDEISIFEEVMELGIQTWQVVESCFVEKSFGPLFGYAEKIKTLEAEQVFLLAHANWYMLDSLERIAGAAGVGCTTAEFEVRVKAQKDKLVKYHALCKNPPERLVVKRYLMEMTDLNGKVLERITRGTMRIEPFSIKLDGTTGVGKSSITNMLVRDILRIQGEPWGDQHIAVINTAAAHMDTLTNATRGVIMDDIRNTKVEFSKVDEGRFIIDLQNMMQTPVLKAALEDKGMTYCHATALVVSTNSPQLQASTTSVEPSAVLRRFQYHIEVKVRPGFQQDTGSHTLPMLDGRKMTEGIYTQAHEFSVRQWMPRARTEAQPADIGTFHVINQGLNYSQLMEFLAPQILRHKQLQLRMLSDLEADVKHELCEHGFTTALRCDHCRAIAVAADNQAGEWFRWFSQSEPTPEVAATLAHAALCYHGLSVCPACHPAEEPAPPVPTIGERVAAALFPTVSGEADEPTVVSMARALSRGRWELEDHFLRAPKTLMTLLFAGVPGVAMAATYSLLALFGGGGTFGLIATASVGASTVYHISAGAVGWVRGRVAGLTVTELRTRMTRIAHRSMGYALMFMFAGLTMALSVSIARRTFEKVADKEEKGAPVARVNVRFAPSPETTVVSPVERCASHVVSTAPITEEPLETLAVEERLELHGGCESVIETERPAMQPPKLRQDVWARRALTDFGRPREAVATMTREQILNRITTQLFCVEVCYKSMANPVRTYGFMVCTNYLLMPAHNFIRASGEYSVIEELRLSTTTAQCGPCFRVRVGKSTLFRMVGDMMLVQVNSGGTMRDLTEFFTDANISGPVPIEEFTRDWTTMETPLLRYMATPGIVVNADFGWSYPGFIYNRPEPTFKGLCGALLVAADRYPRIIAMHTMGIDHHGRACRITQSDLLTVLATARVEGLVLAPSITQESTELYVPAGYEAAAELSPLSERSVLREAPDGAPLMPVGTLKNFPQIRSRSGLGVSEISSLVETQCGEERAHEPPSNIGKATVEVRKLQELKGMSQMDPDVLKLANIDRTQELEALILAGNLGDMLRPLTEVETCSGLPGATGVQRLNLATAPGFPLVGNKRSLVESAATPEQPDAIRLTMAQRAEIKRAELRLASQERMNFVFKCSHKDEAVKIGKEKVRVFEGSQFVLTYLTRMYFLPIMRLYFMFQLHSSSAVGINASGSEWTSLALWLAEYNSDEVLEGDWVHYDMTEDYQEIMVVFGTWIGIAERHGSYTRPQLAMMWTIAEEIARHYALYKGDVTQVNGSNPSGNGLTVFINNEVHIHRDTCAFYALAPKVHAPVPLYKLEGESLAGVKILANMRCTFRPLLPHLHGRFADYVRSTYYGDDFLMAVRPSMLEWYNQLTISAWFATQGKVLTDAKKNPFVMPTTKWCEASYLKRGFRKDADTGHIMAPLTMPSIYKPLHIWPEKLPVSPQAHAAELLRGAIRELFQHGRAEYEARVPRLLSVAEKFGCRDYIPSDMTYNTAMAVWVSASHILPTGAC